MLPSPPSADSITRGCRGGGLHASSSTTTLHGRSAAHEFRFGTNMRIFRLNDYDFGEGVVPLVTYTTLPQFIYGVASTATQTFPLADSQPYNFLNLDLYAQDTWKVTSTLTWTFGLRATQNSNPLNPHDAVARLSGSFASIPHDVNQPLNAVIHTGLGTIFDSTPLAILQPRTAIAWQMSPNTVVRTGFGLFSDLLPGSVVDLVRSQSTVLANVSGWTARHGGRHAARAGRSGKRRRCCGRRKPGVPRGLPRRSAFLRIPSRQSVRMPATGRIHRCPRWPTARALFHGVEFRRRAPGRAPQSTCVRNMSARAR